MDTGGTSSLIPRHTKNKHDRWLSLSTNQIDRMGSLAGMRKLRILSLGRNQIKKVVLFLGSISRDCCPGSRN